jgi:uncharacterized cupredoxin-like copper-binding protein
MTLTKTFKTACVAIGLLGAMAAPSFADSVINVSLADKGGAMDMSKNMGMGMGMMGKMEMAIMSVVVDQKTVPAGKVTFNVTNVSKGTIHEMLVSPIKDENAVLPFIDNENRVDEEASGDLGEVSELDPGKSGSLTLDLKPGMYILFCNVPGHYTAGMWTTITVQ